MVLQENLNRSRNEEAEVLENPNSTAAQRSVPKYFKNILSATAYHGGSCVARCFSGFSLVSSVRWHVSNRGVFTMMIGQVGEKGSAGCRESQSGLPSG